MAEEAALASAPEPQQAAAGNEPGKEPTHVPEIQPFTPEAVEDGGEPVKTRGLEVEIGSEGRPRKMPRSAFGSADATAAAAQGGGDSDDDIRVDGAWSAAYLPISALEGIVFPMQYIASRQCIIQCLLP